MQTAKDIMDTLPVKVKPDDKISTAASFIMEHRFRRLPVVDDNNRLVGVFGVNCLLRLVLPKAVIMEDGLQSVHFMRESLSDLHRRFAKYAHEPISICMESCPEIEVVHPETPLLETLLVLYRSKVSLPVVDSTTGELVGDISYFDVGQHILGAEI